MHIVEIGGGGDQDKCVLVSWSPLIHPTTLTDGLFPDFIVTLVGIQADEGEPWVFYYSYQSFDWFQLVFSSLLSY